MPATSHKKIKVMIMAGGTGGHVFPALAVAQELLSRGCEVQWFGTRSGIEARVVPAQGIAINYLEITGLRGKGVKALLFAPWKIVRAVMAARKILQTYKPQVVLGMGGYAAGPGGIAARQLGVPLVVHEQNARAGTTNKLLARFATRVLGAYPNVLPRSECIGNPVRESIALLPEPAVRLGNRHGNLRLLVLGGSLGAQSINQLVPEALMLLGSSVAIDVRHQCGEKHHKMTEETYGASGVSAEVVPFIEDMAEALGWADLVICRAGALTVSELSAAGVASILVPFPHAIDDHQTANAQWLVAQGAAELRQQSALTAHELKELIMSFTDKRKRMTMAMAARAVARPQATRHCADVCLEVIHG